MRLTAPQQNILIIGLAVLAVSVGSVILAQRQTRPVSYVPPTSSFLPTNTSNTAVTTVRDDTEMYAIQLPAVASLTVTWYKDFEKITGRDFPVWVGLPKDAVERLNALNADGSYWDSSVVGVVVGGKYDKYSVLRTILLCEMFCHDGTLLVNPPTHKIVILTHHGSGIEDSNPLYSYVTSDSNVIIPDLVAPSSLQLVQPHIALTLDQYNNNFGGIRGERIQKGTQIGMSVDGRPVYQSSSGCFYINMPDGETYSYGHVPIDFYSSDHSVDITWKDGTENTDDYQPYLSGGCGAMNCLELVSDKDLAGRTVEAGTTSTGDTVYTLKDPNDQELKDLYDQWYVYGGKKSSYDDFVKSRPVFFWKDILGDWIQWTRSDILPQAECGKPVIYLYPTESTNIAVKLNFAGQITKSIPEYHDGWHVVAAPDGTLTNLADGKIYPYLYWDGVGPTYDKQRQGTVVTAAEADQYLVAALASLGLSSKESEDFREFWVPILKRSRYVRISFLDQATWERAAPLIVTPNPDTVLRVFMDWQPLDAPISIEPQVFASPPARQGFSVVEWGGLLYYHPNSN